MTTPKSASRWRKKRLQRAPALSARRDGGVFDKSVSHAKLHARVDQRDQDVGEQVAEHDDERADHQDRHQDGIVARIRAH